MHKKQSTKKNLEIVSYLINVLSSKKKINCLVSKNLRWKQTFSLKISSSEKVYFIISDTHFEKFGQTFGQLYQSCDCVFLIGLYRSTTGYISISDPWSAVLCSEESSKKAFRQYVIKFLPFSNPFSSSVMPKNCLISDI